MAPRRGCVSESGIMSRQTDALLPRGNRMDWFQQITGFREDGYERTRQQLAVEGDYLVSQVTGGHHRVGNFEVVTLRELRARVGPAATAGSRSTVRCQSGDSRAMHADPALREATFQVASQFNALEMVGPDITPELGVTRYIHDRTQGPACAIAAGAATIWRNYFVPVGRGCGQTAIRQIDTLAGLGQVLSQQLGCPTGELWSMRNGYALATRHGLQRIVQLLQRSTGEQCDALRAELAVAVQRGADVTDLPASQRHTVTQVFCSALPVAYSSVPSSLWAPFARLVLEAAYEATLLAALQTRLAGGAPTVLLTRLGGGAFGNEAAWIDDAISRALGQAEGAGLDVRLVSYGPTHPAFAALERVWTSGDIRDEGSGVRSSVLG